MTIGSRKNVVMLITLLTLTLGLASFSWAGPHGMGGCWGMDDCAMGPGMGHGRGMGMGMMQMTPEQAGKAFDLHHKFMNETAEARRQMLIKRAELAELWRAPEPDKAKIAAKQKELNALRDQIQEKAVPYKAELRQICPNLGQGMGRGPMAPAGPPKK